METRNGCSRITRVLPRAFRTSEALSFLFLWGGCKERRKPILAPSPGHSSSIIQPGPLSVWKKPTNQTEEKQFHNDQKMTTNKSIPMHVYFKEPCLYVLFGFILYCLSSYPDFYSGVGLSREAALDTHKRSAPYIYSVGPKLLHTSLFLRSCPYGSYITAGPSRMHWGLFL